MAGLFSGDLFQGLGQDMTFSLDDPDVAAAARSGGAPTLTSLVSKGTAPVAPSKGAVIPQSSAYSQATPMYVPPPARDNTMIYAIGGLAVVGLLGAMAMSGPRRVTSNKGRRRNRRKR